MRIQLPHRTLSVYLFSPGSGFMRIFFAAFLVAHGVLHLLGTAKAFRLLEVPLLTHRIDRPAGLLWLLAAVLFIITAILLFTLPRWWWVVGTGALVVSE